MIVDQLKNIAKYEAVCPGLAEAAVFLTTVTTETEERRYELSGDNFVSVQSYETKASDACRFENHRRYTDVQFIIAGRERIDVADVDGLPLLEDRYETADVAFYDAPKVYSTADLTDGWFVILFPGETHRPGGGPKGVYATVKKAVVKLVL